MVSVDGVMESPEWSFPSFSADLGQHVLDELREADILVLGRTTLRGLPGVLADAAPDLTKLKAERDATFLVLASADLVSTLTAAGLVDEYRIRVCPVLVGRGRHLFTEDVPAADLELIESRSFSGGVTSLTFRPRANAPARDR
jgi:dihydrofolate reductase